MELAGAAPRIEPEIFHSGEQAVQRRFGVRDRIAEMGARSIRSFMPEQHREFFAHLSYVLIGASDHLGQLWASMLLGREGFIASPDPKLLHIDAKPVSPDPLASDLRPGSHIGVLGIDLATRRRNRANGRVLLSPGSAGLHIEVEQSFGNCPQYIWPRKPDGEAGLARITQSEIACWVELDDERACRLITGADTFFIASQYRDPESGSCTDVDVSHRGGRPGFLRKEENAIVWPEYRGNFYFNTLGNLVTHPSCGLFIPDFEKGDLLQLTGSAEPLWAEKGEYPPDDKLRANCLVRFAPTRILFRSGAIPKAWDRFGRAQSPAGPL